MTDSSTGASGTEKVQKQEPPSLSQGRPKPGLSSWGFALAAVGFAFFSMYFSRAYGYLHWQVIFAYSTPDLPELDPVRSERLIYLLDDVIGRGYRLLALCSLVSGGIAVFGRPRVTGIIALVIALLSAFSAFTIVM